MQGEKTNYIRNKKKLHLNKFNLKSYKLRSIIDLQELGTNMFRQL